MLANNKTTAPSNPKKGIRRGRRLGEIERREERAFYIIILPYLLFMIVIKGIPFVQGILLSFTNYNGFNIDSLSVVGLSNYARVFKDGDAISSIVRTFGFTLVLVPVVTIISILLSLMLCRNIKGQGIFRTIYYLPSILPATAVVLMWKGMYQQNGGLFNQIAMALGQQNINWFDFEHVQSALYIMLLWGAGGGVLVNIAAMKAVPEELYEAATIEGAGYIKRTTKITLPLIANMIYMSIVTSLVGYLQLFAQPVMLTGTGNLAALPLKPVYTFMVHAYQQIFVNARFGYGLALIWVIFIIIMLLTMIMEYTSKYWAYNGE